MWMQFTKDGYQDVIIRSQHYLQAMEKARRYIDWYAPVSLYYGKCTLVTIVGVLWIGMAGAVSSYAMMANHSRYNDPASDSFIPDPAGVAFLAFLLCGSIAYGFCALIDHMADTLLYCFAFNRKFNKGTIKMFVPELIQDLVGHDGVDGTAYGMYGKARPEMYLSTWLNPRRHIHPRDKAKADAKRIAEHHIAQAGAPPRSPASQGAPYATGGYPANLDGYGMPVSGAPYSATAGGYTSGYGGYQG